MSDNSKNSRRIAKNTIVLYIRMLFLMVVNLYTSRVILDALGVDDYGIYNVVGGFVSMFALISAALTSACSRFLNFELAKGGVERQKVVFSTAVGIQWGLAIIVAVLSEAIGIWYVNNVMVLPPERLTAANWCFQFSVFTFCMNLITVPYNASIVAHEKMKTFAYVGIFQGLAQLGISFLVYLEPFDRLIFYALLLMVLQFVVRFIYQHYCRVHFVECKYKFVFDTPLLKQMLGYSAWHLIGNGASVLKTHGVNLVLNLFFGPAINAAKGVANQVESAVHQFVSNFMMAMNPQITQSYAREDYGYFLKLISKGSRYCFYLMFILSLPIIVNADYIMNLWLKEVPEYAVAFAQLTLISAMVSSITNPLITAQNATGDVRNFQIIIGGINLLNLPLSYVALYFGMSPTSVVMVSILVNVIAVFTRIMILPNTVKCFNRKDFFVDVLLKCLLVAVASSLIAIGIDKIIPETFYGFLINVSMIVVTSGFVILYIGFDAHERSFFYSKAVQIIKRNK